ncbi:MAG: single-stranded DNA-binding protein [Alphaproteobacteria bacterium]|nr:single-stranded DNA-binding protein [Alphaproteobacteria bacterium]
MPGSINKVILVGNLGRDPEVRHTASGSKVVNLSLATSDSWKDKSGERQEKTEWHRVVLFNQALADFAEKFLKKGSKVYVEGALQTRKFTDSAGVEKYSTEVVLGNFRGELVSLDTRSGEGRSTEGNAESGSGWDSAPIEADTAKTGTAAFDDEIPF